MRTSHIPHGVQGKRVGEELTPLSYYRDGPFGRAVADLAKRPRPISTVGVVGFGTAALGSYARPGEDWSFYEIDPMVECLARDKRCFDVMANCGNHPALVLGDARINLAASSAARHDVLIIDAFRSDSFTFPIATSIWFR